MSCSDRGAILVLTQSAMAQQHAERASAAPTRSLQMHFLAAIAAATVEGFDSSHPVRRAILYAWIIPMLDVEALSEIDGHRDDRAPRAP